MLTGVHFCPTAMLTQVLPALCSYVGYSGVQADLKQLETCITNALKAPLEATAKDDEATLVSCENVDGTNQLVFNVWVSWAQPLNIVDGPQPSQQAPGASVPLASLQQATNAPSANTSHHNKPRPSNASSALVSGVVGAQISVNPDTPASQLNAVVVLNKEMRSEVAAAARSSKRRIANALLTKQRFDAVCLAVCRTALAHCTLSAICLAQASIPSTTPDTCPHVLSARPLWPPRAGMKEVAPVGHDGRGCLRMKDGSNNNQKGKGSAESDKEPRNLTPGDKVNAEFVPLACAVAAGQPGHSTTVSLARQGLCHILINPDIMCATS